MDPMTRTRTGSLSGWLGLVLAFTSSGRTAAQEAQPALPSTPQSAGAPAAPTEASQPTTGHGQTDQSMEEKENKKDMLSPTPSQSAAAAASVEKSKKGKQEYTGPTTLVELPPTPMLDEEGKQRQDPDGKLMFNPPVRQQRDKKGHPLFDAQDKPVMKTKAKLGYTENGGNRHAPKWKPPTQV